MLEIDVSQFLLGAVSHDKGLAELWVCRRITSGSRFLWGHGERASKF
jgi:hypothetical protein